MSSARWRGAADLTTLLAGCLGGLAIGLRVHTAYAVLLVGAAAVADAVDGPLARRAGGGSRHGRVLDAGADLVAFALAPAAIVLARVPSGEQVVALIGAAVFVAASGWRLARGLRGVAPVMPAGYHGGLPMPASGGLFLALGVLGLPSMVLVAGLVAGWLALGRRPYPGPVLVLREHRLLAAVALSAAGALALWTVEAGVLCLAVAYAVYPWGAANVQSAWRISPR